MILNSNSEDDQINVRIEKLEFNQLKTFSLTYMQVLLVIILLIIGAHVYIYVCPSVRFRLRQARDAKSPESRKLQDNTQDVPSAPGDKSDDG